MNEGQLQDDFTGRKWDVSVTSANNARKATEVSKAEAARERAAQQLTENIDKVDTVLKATPAGMTFTKLRERTGVKTEKLQAAITRLEELHRIERCTIIATNKQPYEGYKLTTGNTGNTGNGPGTIPLFPPGTDRGAI